MTEAALATSLIFREYRPVDFAGVQQLWRNEAGWGELTADQFAQWYIDIPDGPAILVVAQGERGDIAGLITMTPHRIALREQIVTGARIAANIVASEYQAAVFDFASHPLVGMLLECRNAAARRGFSVLFGLPKVNWMNLLRIAATKGVALVPHVRIGCMERSTSAPPNQSEGLKARPIDMFTNVHAELWAQTRSALDVSCAIHRDLETLCFRNGGHRNFELVSTAGTLAGYATVRADGLLFDIAMVERGLYDPALAALLRALDGDDITDLKLMMAPYYDDPAALGFGESQYKFGFVADAIDGDLAGVTTPDNWYLAGGG